MPTANYFTQTDLREVADVMEQVRQMRQNTHLRFAPLTVRKNAGGTLGRIVTPVSVWDNIRFVPAK